MSVAAVDEVADEIDCALSHSIVVKLFEHIDSDVSRCGLVGLVELHHILVHIGKMKFLGDMCEECVVEFHHIWGASPVAVLIIGG